MDLLPHTYTYNILTSDYPPLRVAMSAYFSMDLKNESSCYPKSLNMALLT